MIYVAMFDEVNEGTAIFKCSDTPPVSKVAKFIDLDGKPSDHYIIAPYTQANPADYPGVKPLKMEEEMLLFDLDKDPAETTDLSTKYPEVKEELLRKYHDFLATFQ